MHSRRSSPACRGGRKSAAGRGGSDAAPPRLRHLRYLRQYLRYLRYFRHLPCPPISPLPPISPASPPSPQSRSGRIRAGPSGPAGPAGPARLGSMPGHDDRGRDGGHYGKGNGDRLLCRSPHRLMKRMATSVIILDKYHFCSLQSSIILYLNIS